MIMKTEKTFVINVKDHLSGDELESLTKFFEGIFPHSVCRGDGPGKVTLTLTDEDAAGIKCESDDDLGIAIQEMSNNRHNPHIPREGEVIAKGQPYIQCAGTYVVDDWVKARVGMSFAPKVWQDYRIRAMSYPVTVGGERRESPRCGRSSPYVIKPGKAAYVKMYDAGGLEEFARFWVVPIPNVEK